MRVVVVAHRPTATNRALASAGWPGLTLLASPRAAAKILRPGDLALGRLDVRQELDGIEDGLWELARLARSGVRVLNPPRALLATHDKLVTARVLEQAGVPHPRACHLASPADRPRLRFPLVLKPRFGSWGRDVVRCDGKRELKARLAELATRPWFGPHGVLAQELVPPVGHDLRLIVSGGRVVGAARRVAAPGEWRTNVALGGRSEPVDAPAAARELARAAAAAAGADLVGVDLLPHRQGWVVLELNGAADFLPHYAPRGDVFAAAAAALVAAAAPAGAALSDLVAQSH